MSISAISSGASSIFGILQQLTGGSSTSATTATTATDGSSTSGTTASGGQVSGHHHHGHHGLSPQAEDAITTALSNAPAGSDPNQTIQTALQTFLNDPTAQNSTSTTTSATSDQNFEQALQAHGVSQDQLHQDIGTALQNNSGSNVNASKLFSNYSPGALLDTAA